MTWDPLQYGNITILPVAVAEYWTPGKINIFIVTLYLPICIFLFLLDIFLYSAADSGSFNQWDTSCKLIINNM
jgi:hypothetical protein